MSRVATFTINPTVDVSTHVARVVAEDKLRCAAPRREPGGGGINVARVVRELGEDATALWTCGGAIGVLLGECLDAMEVPHRPIPIAELTRENMIVLEESSGHQYRFGFPGPRLSPEEVARCEEVVAALDPRPEFLVLSGSLPPGVDAGLYARLAKSAQDGTRVVIDTSGEALRRSLEAGACILKPNLRELSQLVGRELHDDDAVERAARELVEEGGAQIVVVSLGAGGALVHTRDGSRHLRAPTVPIRSKVGAGDSMVAGLVVGLLRGLDPFEAARLAVATGAAAVMTEGTQLARREDVEKLFHP